MTSSRSLTPMDHRGEAFKLYKTSHSPNIDTERRSELRTRITSIILQFLAISSPQNKFIYREFLQIIIDSPKNIRDFSSSKAEGAFLALEELVIVIFEGSWKSECQVVKLYGGYIQTMISTHLVNIHFIIQRMGMTEKLPGLYVFKEAPQPDHLIGLAFESLVASLECRMVTSIQERLRSQDRFLSAQDVIQWRGVIPGDVEKTVVELEKMGIGLKEEIPGSGSSKSADLSSSGKIHTKIPEMQTLRSEKSEYATLPELQMVEPFRKHVSLRSKPERSTDHARVMIPDRPKSMTSAFDNRKLSAQIETSAHQPLRRTPNVQTPGMVIPCGDQEDYNLDKSSKKESGKSSNVKSGSIDKVVGTEGDLKMKDLFSQTSEEEVVTHESGTSDEHMVASVLEVKNAYHPDVIQSNVLPYMSGDMNKPDILHPPQPGKKELRSRGGKSSSPNVNISDNDASNYAIQSRMLEPPRSSVEGVSPDFSQQPFTTDKPPKVRSAIDSVQKDRTNRSTSARTVIYQSKSEPISRRYSSKAPTEFSFATRSSKQNVQRHNSLGSPLSSPSARNIRRNSTLAFSYDQFTDLQPDEWICEHCTMVNDVASMVCHICSKSRNGVDSTDTPRSGESKKLCEQCTLENEFGATSCVACGGILRTIQTYV